MTGRILVTGSTGNVGGRLLAHLEGREVRAATRDPARLPAGTHAVRFDLDDATTFAPALDGVSRVFLVARPGDDHPERTAFPLVDEMRRQGVEHVVDLSAMGVEGREDIGLRRVERHIEDSGLAFTHLRPNWFMQIFSTMPLLAGIRASGSIRVPAAGARISFVDAADVAAVAAAALTGDRHLNRAYTLTGPEPLAHSDVAGLISAASGREVGYEPISDEETRKALGAAGMPPQRIERLLGFYALVRAGLCETVSANIERVLGRPAATFEDFASREAPTWR
jgi:uncharacterized protein YbjT (DUF2867 family)